MCTASVAPRAREPAASRSRSARPRSVTCCDKLSGSLVSRSARSRRRLHCPHFRRRSPRPSVATNSIDRTLRSRVAEASGLVVARPSNATETRPRPIAIRLASPPIRSPQHQVIRARSEWQTSPRVRAADSDKAAAAAVDGADGADGARRLTPMTAETDSSVACRSRRSLGPACGYSRTARHRSFEARPPRSSA